MSDPADERLLLVRARRRVTLQVAGAIFVLLAVFGVVVYQMTVSQQDASLRFGLVHAAQYASVTAPPPCVWLFELRGQAVQRSPGAPAALPLHATLREVAAGAGPRLQRVDLAGHAYLIQTVRRGAVAVQAAMDLRYSDTAQGLLLRTVAGAELVGLLAALIVGQVLARKAIAPLGEALARQRRFTADVSHELRTPLTRLHTRAQLLARRLRQPELIDEVDQLVAGTRQLGEVVQDLLLSVEPSRVLHPFGPVDLGALAEEVVRAEAPRADVCGVKLEVVREDGGEHVVRGTQSALRRVISALLDNALRHTGSGGHIWVTLTRTGDTIQLTVRDDGVGLDPRDAEHLFARLGTRSHNPGFGLGLALVREVVDGHGGTIGVNGRPGAGAAFTIRLPQFPDWCVLQ